jgi:hypothetical protein
MQKKVLSVIGFILIVLIVIGGIIFKAVHPFNPSGTIEPGSSVNTIITSYCTSDQLKADARYEPAAGNIYGTLTITNTSNRDCNIVLGNSIHAEYDATNITTGFEDMTPNNHIYLLKAGSKVYSQVHYPNGPQCQSQISPKPIVFSYEANNIKVDFDSTSVSACSGNENTQIDIWPLSINPINS